MTDKNESIEVVTENPKQYFYDSLSEYLREKEGSESSEKAKAILIKFELIRQIVIKEMPENEFFSKIIQHPVESIVDDLETESVDTLASRAKKL